MRKMRLFQSNAYLSLDFLDKELEIIELEDQPVNSKAWQEIQLGPDKPSRYIAFERPQLEPTNAIRDELDAFGHCIQNNLNEAVSIEDWSRPMLFGMSWMPLVIASKTTSTRPLASKKATKPSRWPTKFWIEFKALERNA